MAVPRLVLAAMLVAILMAPRLSTASLRSTMAVGGLSVPTRGLLRSADLSNLIGTDDRSSRRMLQANTGLNMISFGDDDFGQADLPANARMGIKRVAGGLYHAIALMADGTIISWGDDSVGQLSKQPHAATLKAGGGVAEVAAGAHHSLVLLNNGTVLGWGDDSTGQSTVPEAAKSGITAIAAGATTSLALTSRNSVISWGNHLLDAQIPDSIASRTDITAISARDEVSMVLTSNGTILMWGSVVGPLNGVDFRALMPPNAEPAVAIAAGGTVFMAVGRDGKVYPWGVIGSDGSLPPSDDVMYANGRSATDVAAGYSHCLVLMSDGNVIAFGDNDYGQLSVPRPASLQGEATLVACGYRSSYVLGPSLTLPAILPPPPPDTTLLPDVGSVTREGHNAVYWYPSRYNSTSGTPEQTFQDVVTIAGSPVTRLVYVDSQGAVNVWSSDNVSFQETELPEGNIAHSVVSGPTFFMVLLKNGTVRGYDHATLTEGRLPLGITDNVAVSMAAGAVHGLVLLQTGRVTAFGDCSDNKTLVPEEACDGVTAVAAGGTYSLALRDGNVIFWGVQADDTVAKPKVVSTGGNVKAIASGATHCLALLNNGTAVAWGSNTQGESWVPPAAQSGVAAIAAGNGFSLALLETGRVVQWGWSSASDASTTPSFAKSGITQIFASWDIAFALLGTAPDVVAPSPPLPPSFETMGSP